MPTLNIEGRKVKVDDSFLKLSPADQQSTVEEIASQLGIKTTSQDAPVSGLKDQFSAGFESNVELPGLTVETLGKTAQDKNVEAAGKWLRDLTAQPKNFVSASDRFINPKPGDSYVDPVMGFGWGNAPGAAAEVGGQVAGDMMARGGTSLAMGGLGAAGGFVAGGPVGAGAGFTGGAVGGALAGPAVLEFMRVAGPVAIARAQNADPPREVPTWEDWQYAAGTAGLAGALNAIGIKGIGKLNAGVGAVGKKTATGVVTEAAKETGKKALTEGVTEAGQSVVQQAGETAFTDKGLQIDLKQAVGEGIIGAGTAGGIDATRNARPVFNTAMDVRSVDSEMRNNPDAQTKAEITQKVNNIADRMKGSGKAPLSKEVNASVTNLRNQIEETLKNQNLSPDDKRAIEDGLKTANGLDNADVDAIAGRSENPSEIKALIRKIQVVREMTMQQQSAKGLRGAIADTAYNMGAPTGAFIGDTMFPGGGAAAGAFIGDRIGTGISRRLKGNQTQGNAIDQLVGKKQARRAAMLLDRYGPSEATTALNTLSEKAAANSAQKEIEAQEQKDWQDTINRIKMSNAIRKNAREQWENAPPELKSQKKAEKEAVDLKTREERLKGLAIRSEQSRVRLATMVNRLESEKSTNALRVDKAQAERDLANAKAQGAAKGQILDLSGKLLKLVDDIKLREQALKKSIAVTKRAEKMAERVPQAKQASKAAATQTAKRYAKMTAEQMDQVEVDQFGRPIKNTVQFRLKAEDIMKLQADGLVDAIKFDDKAIGNLFIEAIGDFKNTPGHKNQAKRMAIYERILRDVPRDNLDAQRFIALYIRPLAFAFEAASGDPDSFGSSSRRPEGREDFGTDEDTGEDIPFDMPPATPRPAPSAKPVEAVADKVLSHSNVFIKSAEGQISALKDKADTLHAETGAIIQEAESAYQKKFGNVANDNWYNDGWADMVSEDGKKKLQEYRRVQTELAKAELDVNYDKLVAYLPEDYTARRVTATRSMSSPKVQALYDMEEPAYRIDINRKSDGEWVGTIDGLYLFAKDVNKFFAKLSRGERPESISEMAQSSGLYDDKLVKGLSEGTRTDRGQSNVSRLPSNDEDPPF